MGKSISRTLDFTTTANDQFEAGDRQGPLAALGDSLAAVRRRGQDCNETPQETMQ